MFTAGKYHSSRELPRARYLRRSHRYLPTRAFSPPHAQLMALLRETGLRTEGPGSRPRGPRWAGPPAGAAARLFSGPHAARTQTPRDGVFHPWPCLSRQLTQLTLGTERLGHARGPSGAGAESGVSTGLASPSLGCESGHGVKSRGSSSPLHPHRQAEVPPEAPCHGALSSGLHTHLAGSENRAPIRGSVLQHVPFCWERKQLSKDRTPSLSVRSRSVRVCA